MQEKVLVGMSGGVDSSVAALVLKNNGYDITGVTLKLCDADNDSNIADAKAVCGRLGIEHIVMDLRPEFDRIVIGDFISEYKNGKTPNPCIVCNKNIKFGIMLERAIQLGFDKIATGHYVRSVLGNDGRWQLLKAEDCLKDQSYVLYCLTQNQLAHSLFPLGDLKKTEIRKMAEDAGFINADRDDSQDICFVPDGDYAHFIEQKDGFVSKIGNYIDVNHNILGEHKGVIRYTIGQRKGLGIALGKPAFVIDKNPLTNEVVLGDEQLLFKKTVEVKNINFIPFDSISGEIRACVKLRYRHNAAEATIHPSPNGVTVEFDEPQRASSSGQSAVFYDRDRVIGGGIII